MRSHRAFRPADMFLEIIRRIATYRPARAAVRQPRPRRVFPAPSRNGVPHRWPRVWSISSAGAHSVNELLPDIICVMAFFVGPRATDRLPEPDRVGKSPGELQPIDTPQGAVEPRRHSAGFRVRSRPQPPRALGLRADHLADPSITRSRPASQNFSASQCRDRHRRANKSAVGRRSFAAELGKALQNPRNKKKTRPLCPFSFDFICFSLLYCNIGAEPGLLL